MQTFDVTLNGFDGETDATDHLVKWVRAANEERLEQWLKDTGLWDHLQVQTPKGERWLALSGRETFEDGVDVLLIGNTAHTKNDEPFDPQVWIDESQAVLA